MTAGRRPHIVFVFVFSFDFGVGAARRHVNHLVRGQEEAGQLAAVDDAAGVETGRVRAGAGATKPGRSCGKRWRWHKKIPNVMERRLRQTQARWQAAGSVSRAG